MAIVLLLFKSFALTFSALLPLVNPLGSALVFLGFVGSVPDSVFADLARKIAISTTVFMLVIELVGTGLLEFFGISLPVVQVAGGLVLASMGWSLLNQQESNVNPDRTVVRQDNFLSYRATGFLSAHVSRDRGSGLHRSYVDPERARFRANPACCRM